MEASAAVVRAVKAATAAAQRALDPGDAHLSVRPKHGSKITRIHFLHAWLCFFAIFFHGVFFFLHIGEGSFDPVPFMKRAPSMT